MQNMPPSARQRALADQRHSTRASPALQALTECDPALATLSLWCHHRDSKTTTLAETQGSEIRYGADFAALPLHLQIGVSGHHILHVALQHSRRMEAMAERLGPDFEPDLWQMACDAIVNEAVLRAGHALPRPALTLSGLLGALGQPAPPEQVLAAWDSERLYHQLQRCESSGGRGRRPGAVREHAHGQGFAPDLSPEQGDTEQAGAPDGFDTGDWQAHMARAMAAGRTAGVGLGALGASLGDLPKPQVPWELILRRLLLQAALPRPTANPARPSARWMAQAGAAQAAAESLPPWQPRQCAPVAQPRLVVALDCSGSIAPVTLRLFMAEIIGITRRMQAELRLLIFDEGIRDEMVLSSDRARAALETLTLPEGGGTDFRPVIARAAELTPSALVVLSDLDGPFGPTPRRLKTIWASPAPEPPSPPFGHILSLAR
ncbi:MAG: hypothetical protein EA407_10200 [Rhodobacteraceae bacterium]|nr:MAG: hypothetical protein EA407_10200 [Paracoccaceae bacterium]